MEPDESALRELLTLPLEPESRVRSIRTATIAGGVLGIVVMIFSLAMCRRGDSETSETSVASGSDSTTTSEVAAAVATGPESISYPDGRFAATLVHDPIADVFVLVGGWKEFRADPILDPWSFDPATASWLSLEQSFEPPGRELAAAVYVDSMERVLLVGGTPQQTNSCASWSRVVKSPVDVWLFDTPAESWERVNANGMVPDRWGHSIAYDPVADLVVLFGGVGTEIERSGRSALLGDTWVYDPSAATWESVESPIAPSPRSCPGMVYDPTDGSIILWGGATTGTSGDSSIWRFDTAARSWTEQVPPDGTGPAPRWLHRMVYLPESQRVLVIGGTYPQVTEIEGGTATGVANTDEVWALDPATGIWEPMSPLPAAMSGHAAASDDADLVVLYAWGSTLLYDVDSGTWTDITPYDDLDWDN